MINCTEKLLGDDNKQTRPILQLLRLCTQDEIKQNFHCVTVTRHDGLQFVKSALLTKKLMIEKFTTV